MADSTTPHPGRGAALVSLNRVSANEFTHEKPKTQVQPPLLDEFFQHARPLSARLLDRLLAKGISADAVFGSGRMAYRDGDRMRPNSIMSADIVVTGRASFEWRRAGRNDTPEPAKALIWLALDIAANPVDVIAWQPSTGAISTLEGTLDIADETVLSQFDRQPVPLHFDALAWLQAERRGALVTDQTRRGGILRFQPRLSVATREDAARLRALVRIDPPKITVSQVSDDRR
jgi:hypothetical protein